MKWRLYKDYFQGPGQFRFGETIFEVAEDGTFDIDELPTLPLWAIAAKVGGKRDRPYSARK